MPLDSAMSRVQEIMPIRLSRRRRRTLRRRLGEIQIEGLVNVVKSEVLDDALFRAWGLLIAASKQEERIVQEFPLSGDRAQYPGDEIAHGSGGWMKNVFERLGQI